MQMLRKKFIQHIERRFDVEFVEYREECVRAKNFYAIVRIDRKHIFRVYENDESKYYDEGCLEAKIERFAMDYFGEHIEAKVYIYDTFRKKK